MIYWSPVVTTTRRRRSQHTVGARDVTDRKSITLFVHRFHLYLRVLLYLAADSSVYCANEVVAIFVTTACLSVYGSSSFDTF